MQENGRFPDPKDNVHIPTSEAASRADTVLNNEFRPATMAGTLPHQRPATTRDEGGGAGHTVGDQCSRLLGLSRSAILDGGASASSKARWLNERCGRTFPLCTCAIC